MHAAVDAMRAEVTGAQGAGGPLEELETLAVEVKAMRAGLERLEPHLEDLSGVVTPLGPAAQRLGRIAGRSKPAAQDAASK